METDTLSNKVVQAIDTVKATAIKLTDNKTEAEVTAVDWERTLFTALIGALIAQGLIILINWIKNKIELNTKKNLLTADLKSQREVIVKLNTAYETLLDKFQKRDTKKHSYASFEDLHTDIYESVSKTDLFKIFGKRMTKIVNIYKTVRFLKEYSVDAIYRDYIINLDNHLKEKRDNPEHDYFCVTHLGFIDIATGQINNNTKTIGEVLTDIDEFITT